MLSVSSPASSIIKYSQPDWDKAFLYSEAIVEGRKTDGTAIDCIGGILGGCYYGVNCGRNADSVGVATTRAVVSAIVVMIVATGIITMIFEALGI